MKTQNLTPWRRFLNLLELEKKDISQIFYYAIFSGIVSLSVPLGFQAIVNLIQGAEISTSWVILVILVTLGVISVGALDLMQLRIIETIQQRILVKSSFELIYRFPKIKLKSLRKEYPPELANRFFDTLTLQKGISKILIDVPAALFQIIFALIILSFYHQLFIIFGLILLVFIYVVFKLTAEKGLNTSLQESKYKYKIAHWIQEVARSIISFKLSGKTSLALQKNDELVGSYLDARESHFRVIKMQYIFMIAFKAVITAGLLVIGGLLVLQQQMNIGQFVAAEIIILLVISSVEKLILSLENMYDLLTSIEKLGQVVDKPLESQEGEVMDYTQGFYIDIDHVTYKVEDRVKPVLSNISLSINPQSRVLISGESGSGKSSILRILSGVISPDQGDMYVNGLSIKGLKINHYRAHLGLSFSKEFPFEASLRENLTFGNKEISDQEIFEVIHQVRLDKFLKKIPKGLNTILYPEGERMSYSIAKKIILARALLKKPKLLILEDALYRFEEEDAHAIIDFLCDKRNPWALVVVSSNPYWKTYCKEVLNLKK